MRSSRATVLRVRRRCLVCDAETVQDEPADTFEIGTPCPECHAPTERVEILARLGGAPPNPHAVELGRLGGQKGGPARAAALSPARRREIAIKAARTRWAKRRGRRPPPDE